MARTGHDDIQQPRAGELVLAPAVLGAMVLSLARSRPREARLAEQARVRAQASIQAVRSAGDAEFKEYIAGLCRCDGCTEVR